MVTRLVNNKLSGQAAIASLNTKQHIATTSLEAAQLLTLASPVITVLLALAFLYLWVFQTRTPYVLMIGTALFSHAFGTLWQLLPPSWPGAGLYGIAACCLYLLAA